MYATAHVLHNQSVARRDPSVQAAKDLRKVRRSLGRRQFILRLRSRA